MLKLESYREIPPVFFIELTIQKARRLPLLPGNSWRFIEQNDRVQVQPLKPVEGQVLEDEVLKLEPLGVVEKPEPEPEPEPIGRRSTLKKALGGLAGLGRAIVGLEPVKLDPPQIGRRRTTRILMGVERSKYRQRRR